MSLNGHQILNADKAKVAEVIANEFVTDSISVIRSKFQKVE